MIGQAELQGQRGRLFGGGLRVDRVHAGHVVGHARLLGALHQDADVAGIQQQCLVEQPGAGGGVAERSVFDGHLHQQVGPQGVGFVGAAEGGQGRLRAAGRAFCQAEAEQGGGVGGVARQQRLCLAPRRVEVAHVAQLGGELQPGAWVGGVRLHRAFQPGAGTLALAALAGAKGAPEQGGDLGGVGVQQSGVDGVGLVRRPLVAEFGGQLQRGAEVVRVGAMRLAQHGERLLPAAQLARAQAKAEQRARMAGVQVLDGTVLLGRLGGAAERAEVECRFEAEADMGGPRGGCLLEQGQGVGRVPGLAGGERLLDQGRQVARRRGGGLAHVPGSRLTASTIGSAPASEMTLRPAGEMSSRCIMSIGMPSR